MFCSNCGKNLPEGAKFCDGCGNSLTSTENNATSEGYVLPSLKASSKPSPKPKVKRPKRTEPLFKNAPVATSGLNTLLTFLLVLFLIVSAVLTIAHGSLHNFVGKIDFGDADVEDFMYDMLGTSRYTDYEIEAMNDKKIRKIFQEDIVSTAINAAISGNIRNDLISEKELRSLIKENVEYIYDVTGYKLDSYNIESTAKEIYDELYDLANNAHREVEKKAGFTLILMSKWFKTCIAVVVIVLVGAILFLNRNEINRGLKLVAVPVVVKAAIGLALCIAKPFVVNFIYSKFDYDFRFYNEWLKGVINAAFSGYQYTAVTLTVWCAILGVAGLVLAGKLKKTPAVIEIGDEE